MALLLFFSVLLFFYLRSKSVVILFILLQIVSLSGIFFIGLENPIDSIFKAYNLGITIVILTLIISPWRKIKDITKIYFLNEIKLRKLTKFLIVISGFTFIVLLTTSIIVWLLVDDINTFKYAEGVSTDFYYSLPFNVKAFILSTYLYNFSYFLIPLHFYYLARGESKLAFFCFLFSLNIILYGLTYFSRSVIIQYAFLYSSFFIILYNTITKKVQQKIKRIVLIVGTIFIIYFISTTFNRFSKDISYAETIPLKSKIQDPVIYSYFDYLSQWYNNSLYVLNNYDFKTFKGQISLQPVLSILGQYGIINYNSKNYLKLRQQLWPKHWYTFNGFVAYVIYDFGYILSIVLSLIYYYIVSKLRPRNNQISLLKLFLLVLLIQLPLMAIFYSTVGGIIIPLLLYIPIFFYLKTYIIKR